MEQREEALTDRDFWLKYWESKKDLILEVSDKNFFSELFRSILQEQKPTSAIELGGFPGHFSIYLRKKYNIDTALFDFVIHEALVAELVQKNQLQRSALETIEGDIFKYQPNKQ